MISRIGVDIVSVSRFDALLQRQPKVIARLFSPQELASVGQGRQRVQRLAARFAAKEAIIKAVKGLHGSRYVELEILRRSRGAPLVRVSGPLQAWLERQRLQVAVSFSHENEYAIATAWMVEGCVGVEPRTDLD
jgi:holo-[acyl-carrier protein] synthase